MNRNRKRVAGERAAASRRRLLAVAAAAPVLAGAAQQAARAATTTPATTTPATTTPAAAMDGAAMAGADSRAGMGVAAGAAPLRPVATTAADWEGVDDALRGVGAMKGPMLFRVPFPRADLSVVSQRVRLVPAVIGVQIGFVRYEDGSTMLVGDVAVTEDELQGFSAALQQGGIAQTAIHKHLLGQRPEIWWIHLHAHGHDPVALARALRAALDHTSTPAPRPAPEEPPPLELDTAGIDAALGTQGIVGDGLYQCLFRRRETMVDDGRELPPGLGSTSALNLQPLGGGRAALIGDFALTAGEVQDVLRLLTEHDIDVVCLHNHSLTDETRLFFIHCWAVGDAVGIAEALRPAIDATNVEPVEGEAAIGRR